MLTVASQAHSRLPLDVYDIFASAPRQDHFDHHVQHCEQLNDLIEAYRDLWALKALWERVVGPERSLCVQRWLFVASTTVSAQLSHPKIGKRTLR